MSEALPKQIQILPIAEEHIESFHKCLDIVARERLYLAAVEAPPLAATRDFVLSSLANDTPQFVALLNHFVIGWCDISPHQWEGFQHSGQLGMGVHPEYRRLGIGRQLVVQTIQKAKAKGLERIELEVFASNALAIGLYEKLGFLIEGRKKRARKLDGNYDDIIEMALFV